MILIRGCIALYLIYIAITIYIHNHDELRILYSFRNGFTRPYLVLFSNENVTRTILIVNFRLF